jgi:hypothetical protein
MSSTNIATPSRIPLSRVLLAGVIASAASIVANLILRWLGMALIDVPADFMPLATTLPVIQFTVIYLIIAVIVFALINRFTRDPVRIFRIVAIVALIISLIPDIMLLVNPGAMPMGTVTFSAVVILILMHLVSFAIVWWAFTIWAPQGHK